MRKLKFVFEGNQTIGDGNYIDRTLPEYFPDGEMCCNCIDSIVNCSHLEFKKMKPVLKHYLDGTHAVKCSNFRRL